MLNHHFNKRMQSKLLLSLFLFVVLGIFQFTLSSNSTGAFMAGTQCGSCHGNSNDSVSVALFGLPDTFICGQTYNLTLNVVHPLAQKAGINLHCDAGTFIAGAGTQLNASQNEITHTAPVALSGNQATFAFQWKAPNTPNIVTFKGAGNAVNGDNLADAQDHWDLTQEMIEGMFATDVQDINPYVLSTYPNPATNQISVQGLEGDEARFTLFNITGQFVSCRFVRQGNDYIADISTLPAGEYFIKVISNRDAYSARFIKQ